MRNLSWKRLPSDIVARLDVRRLPGPIFDPPRRETAGRVTRWPCRWRNWKNDKLCVSYVAGSETGLQFYCVFVAKLHHVLPCTPKWLSKFFFTVHFRTLWNRFFDTFLYTATCSQLSLIFEWIVKVKATILRKKLTRIVDASSVGSNWLILGSGPS